MSRPPNRKADGLPNCWIALGGNMGDVVESMDNALDCLGAHDRIAVVSVSHVYETQPVGPVVDGIFLNAAAGLQTDLSPLELLPILKETERTLGRTAASRWDQRTIDLDMLMFGSEQFSGGRLTLPHPHMWYRRFVLDPLNDIAAATIHPTFNVTIDSLRKSLLQRPLPVCLVGTDVNHREGEAPAHDALPSHDAGTEVSSLQIAREFLSSIPQIKLIPCEADVAATDDAVVLTVGEAGVVDLTDSDGTQRTLDLGRLPGSLSEQLESVVTAMLDEPRRHSRPLRRMP